ncbi:MAG TPA: hypothetical protein VIH22_14755 [Cyclobacteriaceae bacterium]
MNQLPDELFRKRLENLRTAPPSSAWTRIEGGLRRHQRGLWLKIAAAVLLLITASIFIWSLRDGSIREPLVAGKEPAPQQETLPQPPERVQPRLENDRMPEIAAEETTQPAASAKLPPQNATSIRDRNVETIDKDMMAFTNPESSSGDPDSLIAVEPTRASEFVADVQPEVASYKLVLEADEVSAKYLRKNSVADATDDKTKTSGLKKLLDKAGDLKNNQDPIGDLRQMKDDIFALNFKKRDQNKR